MKVNEEKEKTNQIYIELNEIVLKTRICYLQNYKIKKTKASDIKRNQLNQ